MEMEQKNYYAVIPANVRYDKRLKPLARLLYGEITALCNEKGYCWASNSYFAELYEISQETISRYISQLREYGYIEIDYNKAEQNTEKRKIYIAQRRYCQNNHDGIDQTVKGVLTEKSRRYCQNNQDGIDQTVKHNNTNNNTNNNTGMCVNDNHTKKVSESDYTNPNGLLNLPHWDWDIFQRVYIFWFMKLTGLPVSELTQTVSAKNIHKLEWLKDNFENRTVHAGISIFETLEWIAQDKSCQQNTKFRGANYLDGVISRLVDGKLAKSDPASDEGEGGYTNPSFDYFEYS